MKCRVQAVLIVGFCVVVSLTTRTADLDLMLRDVNARNSA
jgi:hypothetical protein